VIKPEQIPDSVLKALAESMGCQWCMQDADDRGILSEHVAAAINAWPGLDVASITIARPGDTVDALTMFYLPIKEASNNE